MGQMTIMRFYQLGASSLDGGMKPKPIEWLQQIIQSACFERPNRMLIVSTAEDHDWHVLRRDTIQNLKAVGILHFDIEQQQIGFATPHCGNGLKRITALGNDLN